MKELFQKLGFFKNQCKETEIKNVAKPNNKETINNESLEKLNGIVFNWDKNDETLKGCFFSKEE